MAQSTAELYHVRSPYDGHEAGTVAIANAADLDLAIARAHAAARATAAIPRFERQAVLRRVAAVRLDHPALRQRVGQVLIRVARASHGEGAAALGQVLEIDPGLFQSGVVDELPPGGEQRPREVVVHLDTEQVHAARVVDPDRACDAVRLAPRELGTLRVGAQFHGGEHVGEAIMRKPPEGLVPLLLLVGFGAAGGLAGDRVDRGFDLRTGAAIGAEGDHHQV